jgi:hypothetical protein
MTLCTHSQKLDGSVTGQDLPIRYGCSKTRFMIVWSGITLMIVYIDSSSIV